jgi:hypothetical protein
MRTKALAGVLVLVSLAAPVARGQSALGPGQAAIGSRAFGSVYAPAALAPTVSALLTGPDSGTAGYPVRGAGPSLAGPSLSLLSMPDGRVIAAPAASSFPGRFTIDPATGNRTLLPGTTDPLWTGGGELIALDNETILAIADDFNAGLTGDGKLIRYHIPTATSTLVTGIARGNGPVMYRPRSLARLDANTVLVVEFELDIDRTGTVLYAVDLPTGNRTVVSTISSRVPGRYSATNGVRSATRAPLPFRGTGPTLEHGIRGLAVLGGRALVAGTSAPVPGNSFPTGILDVDPTTGDRTLVVGTARLGTTILTVPAAPGSSQSTVPDSPTQLLPFGTGHVIFSSTFGAPKIWAMNPATRALRVVADLEPQILPPRRTAMQFSGLALAPCAPAGGSGITIVSQPFDAATCPGGPASIEVLVEPGLYLYQWRRDGVPIDPAIQPSAVTPRLVFNSVGPADRATYDCVITSACGSVTTDTASLDFCPADFDCSGFLDSDDFVLFLDQYGRGCVGAGLDVFGPNAQCLRNADYDASGFVDADDFVAYLAAYAEGC